MPCYINQRLREWRMPESHPVLTKTGGVIVAQSPDRISVVRCLRRGLES